MDGIIEIALDPIGNASFPHSFSIPSLRLLTQLPNDGDYAPSKSLAGKVGNRGRWREGTRRVGLHPSCFTTDVMSRSLFERTWRLIPMEPSRLFNNNISKKTKHCVVRIKDLYRTISNYISCL